MRRNLSALLPVVLCLLATGCGSNVTYVASDPTVISPKPEGYEMPYSYAGVERPHKVLGELQVTKKIKPSFQETSTFDLAMNEMRDEARKHGADAICSVKTLDSQEGGTHGRLTLVGTLVIFTAPMPTR